MLIELGLRQKIELENTGMRKRSLGSRKVVPKDKTERYFCIRERAGPVAYECALYSVRA